MDIKLKQTALQNLAKTAGEVAETAIRKEFDKIISVLQCETEYNFIDEHLELLDTIAYRIYEKAVGAIEVLLERLKGLELTYREIPGYPTERVHKYQNNFTLMVKALEVLVHIRYYQPSKILDIFFDYSSNEEVSVAKQAKHGIEELAEYDLDIFYGDGKDWHGLGWGPQEKILEKIGSFDKIQKQKYFYAIIIACEKILSPTITGTSSTYKTVTWRTGAMPVNDSIIRIRKNTLNQLQNLYTLVDNVDQKKSIINSMLIATRHPHSGDYGDDLRNMIFDNTTTMLKFMKSVIDFDDMQILQQIEHEAYWLLYHWGSQNKEIHDTALEIRDKLYGNAEYQIFRILIGFNSIFHDWEKGREEKIDYDFERKYREEETVKLADSINIDSYDKWEKRIIQYASIKSNDMAMFPYFGKFLEHFGQKSPTLALKLISEVSNQIEQFIVAILSGISETEKKEDAYSLIKNWCSEGKYLFHIARFFEFSNVMNEELLSNLFEKAIEVNDLNTLNQIILSISAQHSKENKHLIKKLIVPALKILTQNKNSKWIFGFWYRKERDGILTDMDIEGHRAILENLFWLPRIDYHAEEILYVIAERSPELVIQFFCDRLLKDKDVEDEEKYQAVPYNFDKLSEPLSDNPEIAINILKKMYDNIDDSLFTYRGARLLKNIFPGFPPEFQEKLLKIIQSKKEKDLLFVTSILRNYDNNPNIYDVCKETIKIIPDDSDIINIISIILQTTGVVTGEYGFVYAYEQKKAEIQPWLQDDSAKVRKFAQKYILSLEKQIDAEQKRADEDITLRKYHYGAGED